jgi:protein-disulfide isomerase
MANREAPLVNTVGGTRVAISGVHREAMRVRTLALPLLLVLAAALVAPAATANPDPAKVYAVPVGNAPQRGQPDAKVTIVVFSEFKCPYCARVEPTLEAIAQKYGARVRIVWKHYIVHPTTARDIHRAAAAAAAQGKFWEFHGRVFADWEKLDAAGARVIAEQLGLDMKAFDAYLASGQADAVIDEDQKLGQRFGVSGVPAFFINGRHIAGAQPIEKFTTLIDEEYAKAEKLGGAIPYDHVLATGDPGVVAVQQPAPQAKPRPGAPDPTAVYAVPVAGAPARGAPEAKLTIVMFGEFKCPFCARVQPTLRDLEAKYGADVRIVFHHLVVHVDKARPIARVGAAAAAQGKFWEWSERVWGGNWQQLDEAGARQIAIDVGCDAGQLDAYIASGQADAVVDADMALAKRFGVSGTPSFFINGRFLAGAQPLDRFVVIADEELAKADAWLAAQKTEAQAKQQKKGKNKKKAKKAAPPAVYDHVLATGLSEVAPAP